ncbi:MAG: A24 family peptidase C-terminal domain-containing protein [Thermoplasmata archaeon]
MLLEYIDITRVIVALGLFSIASYSDYRTRQIENYVWLIGGAIGSLLLFSHLILISSSGIAYLLGLLAIALFFTPYISLERFGISETTEIYVEMTLYILLTALTFLIGFYWFSPENGILMGIVAMQVLMRVFYELNIIHGGADAKALMLIALLFPTYPRFLNFPLAETNISMFETMFPFALTVLLNAVFWFIFYPLVLFLYNAVKGNAKIPHAFFGYKMPVCDVKKKFVWLMEHPVNGKIVTKYTPDKDEDENIAVEVAELERLGRKEVWVTPQIPFIIPITAGLFISVILGNVFFLLIGVSSIHAFYCSQVHLYL